MLAIRRIKHPRGQHANRAIRKTTETVFTVAIVFATTHRQRFAIEWMPPVVHRDRLKMMGIM